VLAKSNTLWNGFTPKHGAFDEADWSRAWVDDGPSPAGNPGPCLHVPWSYRERPEQEPEELWARVYPRAQVGDRLWVKENFAKVGDNDDDIHACPDMRVLAYYRADAVVPEQLRWRSSLFMPRWASRLTLTVTDVRIERLQAISKSDAIAEGATARPNCSGFGDRNEGWSMDWSQVGEHSRFATGGPGPLRERDISLGDPISAFSSFINELHGGKNWNLRPTNLWAENPWVVALTFTVEQRNIDGARA